MSTPSEVSNSRQTFRALDQIRKTFNLKHAELAKVMDLKSEDYADCLFRGVPLSYRTLEKVCKEFGLNLDEFHQLASLPDKPILHPKYETKSFKRSRMRSLATIYKGLVWYRSKEYAKEVFRRFQLDEKHLNNTEAYIDLNVGLDILKFLRRDHFEDSQIKQLGTSSVQANRKSPLSQKLRQYKSPQEIYRAMHEELMDLFDRNWSYKLLSLEDQKCLVEIKTKESTQEVYKKKTVGTREMCLCRQGIYESILFHSHRRFAKIEELRCCYIDGGQTCLYLIKWD